MHTDSPHVNKNVAQSEATRAKLLATSRPLFGARGYADVGTEEIVKAAGVTRGALYHQFADKKDLFRAVVEEVEAQVTLSIAEQALTASDPLAALRLGAQLFLAACADPEVNQILLVDAPSVLGYEEWRSIGERYGMGIIVATLQAGMDAGVLAPQAIRPLAHVLSGALDEAALYVARAADPESARAETLAVLNRMVEGLRPI